MNSRSLKLTLGLVALSAFAVVAASCGSSSSSPTAPTPSPGGGGGGGGVQADVTITITGMNGNQSFSPNPATVTAGRTVAWRNADSIAHTATANDGSFNTGNIAPGATSAPITMATEGSFAYHCQIHPDMVGRLDVDVSQAYVSR